MSLDNEIREAEFAAYREVGGDPRDRFLSLHDGDQPIDVRVTELGEPGDQPPLLLQHGIASATVLFASLLPHLAHRHVIAVDWPGHGLSATVRVQPGAGVRRHVRVSSSPCSTPSAPSRSTSSGIPWVDSSASTPPSTTPVGSAVW